MSVALMAKFYDQAAAGRRYRGEALHFLALLADQADEAEPLVTVRPAQLARRLNSSDLRVRAHLRRFERDGVLRPVSDKARAIMAGAKRSAGRFRLDLDRLGAPPGNAGERAA